MTTHHKFPIRKDILLIPYFSIFVITLFWMPVFGLIRCLEIFGIIVCLNLVFQSRIWQRLTGQNAWNLIPTICLIMPFLFYGIQTLLLCLFFTKFFRKKFLHTIIIITMSTFLYLFGRRVLARVRHPRDRKKLPRGIDIYNHSSFEDLFVVSAIECALLPNEHNSWTIMAKREMFKIPPFSWFLENGAGIPIDRLNGKPTRESAINSIKTTSERIKNGFTAVVFPEATRFDGETEYLGGFFRGASEISFNDKVPITSFVLVWPKLFTSLKNRKFFGIPYFCTGTLDVYENHTFDPRDYNSAKDMNQDIRTNMEKYLIAYLRLRKFNYKIKSSGTS
jgi:1-acyl-sn-glycerol-3-phosphate acyltransferase